MNEEAVTTKSVTPISTMVHQNEESDENEEIIEGLWKAFHQLRKLIDLLKISHDGQWTLS